MWLISLKVYYAAEECIDGITTNADQSYCRANYSEVSPWLALEFPCMSLKWSFTTTTIPTWRTPRSEWQIGFQQQETRCSLEETFWGRSKILNQRTSPTRSVKYVIVQTNKARLSLYGVEVSGPSECNELGVVNSNFTSDDNTVHNLLIPDERRGWRAVESLTQDQGFLLKISEGKRSIIGIGTQNAEQPWGSPIYIANLAIFKIWVFSVTFWHEITLYAIYIDKKRFRTPFLTL